MNWWQLCFWVFYLKGGGLVNTLKCTLPVLNYCQVLFATVPRTSNIPHPTWLTGFSTINKVLQCPILVIYLEKRSECQVVRTNHQQSFSLLCWCLCVLFAEIYCHEICHCLLMSLKIQMEWQRSIFGDANLSYFSYQANLFYIKHICCVSKMWPFSQRIFNLFWQASLK